MKRLKLIVWIIGFIALYFLAACKGFNNGSGYIQFVDGAILVYGAGEYIEKRAHIKKLVESHRLLRERLEHLHKKFDNHIGKDGDPYA